MLRFRDPWIVLILMVLACIETPVARAIQSKKPVAGNDKYLFVGYESIRTEFFGVGIVALVHAGDFFQGLQRVEVGHETQYWKGTDQICCFPSSLMVEIRAAVGKPLRKAGVKYEVPSEAVDLLSSLEFDAQWKKGMELERVVGFSVQKSTETNPSIKKSSWDTVWVYKLTIPSQNRPLTDHLIISVRDRKGER
jgi:hypothetical protein